PARIVMTLLLTALERQFRLAAVDVIAVVVRAAADGHHDDHGGHCERDHDGGEHQCLRQRSCVVGRLGGNAGAPHRRLAGNRRPPPKISRLVAYDSRVRPRITSKLRARSSRYTPAAVRMPIALANASSISPCSLRASAEFSG